MASSVIDEQPKDRTARALARIVAVANAAAVKEGLDLDKFFLRIDEKAAPPTRLWQVHYIPRDYLQSRGGDLMVTVDEASGEIRQLLFGQ